MNYWWAHPGAILACCVLIFVPIRLLLGGARYLPRKAAFMRALPDGPSLVVSEERYQEAIRCIDESKDDIACDGERKSIEERYHEAIRLIEESLQFNPLNHKARFVLAGCAMRIDDFQRVKREGTIIYNELTEDDRRNMGDAVLHLMLAHASKMLGEVDKAVIFASEAAELYPQDPHPYMILGELHEVLGDNAEAEKQCRKALMYQDDPGCKKALNEQSIYLTLCCLGGSLARQEKYCEAERFLSEAMELSYAADSPLAARHRVDIYMIQGNLRKAQRLCLKLKAKFPEDVEVIDTLGKLDAMLQQEMGTVHSDCSYGTTHRSSIKSRDTIPASRKGSHRSHASERSRRGHDRGCDSSRRRSSDAFVPPVLEIAEVPSRVESRKEAGGFCCCLDRGEK